MSKFRTYGQFFTLLGDAFAVKPVDAGLHRKLAASFADCDCIGKEGFFGAREDIVATARLLEVREYAAGAKTYVRYGFKVMDPHGDWSDEYQLLASFGRSGLLAAYTIVRGDVRREVIPTELKVGDTDHVYVTRELKRALMKAKRLGRERTVRTLEKIGVDEKRFKKMFRIPVKDLTWKKVLDVSSRRGVVYRDYALAYLALRGDSNAQCEVAHWFDIEKEKSEYWHDPELAEHWYRKAAEVGNPMGQTNLATMWARDCDKIDTGKRAEMMSLVFAAAEQDFPAALLRLSHCYRCGRCGLLNKRKAAEYQSRYEEVDPKADRSGRLPVHRNTRYGKMTEELMV